MNNYRKDFIKQTAKDYDLPFWVVQNTAQKANDLEGFYQNLESIIKEEIHWEE